MIRDIDLYSIRPFKPKIKANQEITVYTLSSKYFDVNPTPDKIILRDLNGRAKVAEGIENDDIVNVLQLREYVADKLTSLYKNAGSIYFADLSSYLTSEYVNHVFTVLDDFVTTDEFIDGSNIDVLAGSTVAIIERNGRLWFDLLGTAYGHVDLKTDQVIGGYKTFEKTIEIEANDDTEAISFNLHPVNGYGVTYGQTGLIIKGYKNSGLTGEAYSLQYPMKSGTFALTIDVPTNLQNGEGEGSLKQKNATAQFDNQATFGQYNDNKADTLFEVGNGTSDTDRSNAFEVYIDGRAKVYGAPTEDEDVVRKADITSGKVLPPFATDNTHGVVSTNYNLGTTTDVKGVLSIRSAPKSFIDSKQNGYCPIVPKTLDYAVKVGITTNTETLTDTEKADACEWLGAITEAEVAEGYVAKLTSKYRVIRDITLEEDTQEVYITTDENGNTFKLKSVFIMYYGKFTATIAPWLFLRFNGGEIYQMYYAMQNTRIDTETDYRHWIKSDRYGSDNSGNTIWQSIFANKLLHGTGQGLYTNHADLASDLSFVLDRNPATEIGYSTTSTDLVFAKGGRIIFWGIDDDE